jgi:16S rRNA (guanine966-N2)-methyltransferase
VPLLAEERFFEVPEGKIPALYGRMRISGGRARGIPLHFPKGAVVRPATDRLREAVFSSLGAKVMNAYWYDLFAGTGAYGLEAFSRGAAGGIFVEKSKAAIGSLRRNMEAVRKSVGGNEMPMKIEQADVFRWKPPAGRAAEIIFVDPPFAEIRGWAEKLFQRFDEFLVNGAEGIVIFEMPGELDLEYPGWKLDRRIGRGRGQPTCCFYERDHP